MTTGTCRVPRNRTRVFRRIRVRSSVNMANKKVPMQANANFTSLSKVQVLNSKFRQAWDPESNCEVNPSMYMSVPVPQQKPPEYRVELLPLSESTHSGWQLSMPVGHMMVPGTTSPVEASTHWASWPQGSVDTSMHCIQQTMPWSPSSVVHTSAADETPATPRVRDCAHGAVPRKPRDWSSSGPKPQPMVAASPPATACICMLRSLSNVQGAPGAVETEEGKRASVGGKNMRPCHARD
mmetsp:Transcript_12083/g.34947  ORF Transcript_12083/g.34947 Transcript_12083/m.34947 type:complete len:238 (+) Transcript_12083:563-1276(+)